MFAAFLGRQVTNKLNVLFLSKPEFNAFRGRLYASTGVSNFSQKAIFFVDIKSSVVSVPADFATYLLLFHSFAARGVQKHFVDLPPLGRRDVGKTVSVWQRLAGKGSL